MSKRNIAIILALGLFASTGRYAPAALSLSNDQMRMLSLVSEGYRANMQAINSFETRYRLERIEPNIAVTDVGQVNATSSRIILKEGTLGFQGSKMYNSEAINSGSMLRFVKNGDKTKVRPVSLENYVAQSSKPGRFIPFTPKPWDVFDGGFTRGLGDSNLFSITSVEKVSHDGQIQIKISGTRTMPGIEKKPLDVRMDVYYSPNDDYMPCALESYVSGRLVGKAGVTHYQKSVVNGNTVYIPVQVRGFVCNLDGSIKAVDKYDVDTNSIRINQPIPGDKFDIEVTAEDTIYDVDLDVTVSSPKETILFSNEVALGMLAKKEKKQPRDNSSKTLEIPLCEGVRITLTYIPRGQFTMGSPGTEVGYGGFHQKMFECSRPKDEGPQHTVNIEKGFYIGRFELTNAQYRCFEPACHQPLYEKKIMDNDDQPATVTWLEAKEFCGWLSKKAGFSVRLPTEAEWEYACRAQSNARFFWGDDAKLSCRYANVLDEAAVKTWPDRARMFEDNVFDCNDGFVVTAPVGSFKPNGFGLYDMIGNVAEWCEDAYYAYGAQKPAEESQDTGRVWRIVRGGGYGSAIYQARSAARQQVRGDIRRAYGFRVVVEP
jgi:formylglycine-generating enzyme required for sulfatase activity